MALMASPLSKKLISSPSIVSGGKNPTFIGLQRGVRCKNFSALDLVVDMCKQTDLGEAGNEGTRGTRGRATAEARGKGPRERGITDLIE